MHLLRASLAVLLAGALMATPAFAKRTRHAAAHSAAKASPHASTAHPATAHPASHRASVHRASAHHASARHASLHRTRRSRPTVRGQQAIQPERVTQIQQALINAHYLNGDASGQWDSTTIAAMQKYQSDHGWQTRLMPDSRALKALGLGPDYSNALNASQASFGAPVPTNDIPSSEQAGFAQAAGVNR